MQDLADQLSPLEQVRLIALLTQRIAPALSSTATPAAAQEVVIVRSERRHSHDRHPGPNDLALVVEVSDTTLVRERTLKLRLYAAAGIGCSWIVNLVERQVEVYTVPSGPPINLER